jgi:hypothetical protein
MRPRGQQNVRFADLVGVSGDFGRHAARPRNDQPLQGLGLGTFVPTRTATSNSPCYARPLLNVKVRLLTLLPEEML